MSSRRWLDEHFNDIYVKKAQEEGYASRAAYKLLEIQQKDKLIKPGMIVVDLGAAPGGWTQVARKLTGAKGRVIAMDILDMTVSSDVCFIQGDFTEQSVVDQLIAELDGQLVDVVISDMAPNMSGNKSVDQPRSMYLAELALECACNILKPKGSFLTKIFQGEGAEAFAKELKSCFSSIKWRKPKASRPRSNEMYVLASNFLGIINNIQGNKQDRGDDFE